MGYILEISGNSSYLTAPSNSAYDFGTGDFTLQSWVKTTASGTIISRKPTPGGINNGGFLMLIKPGGGVKLAIDNGYGFTEIDASDSIISDGNWHFLTGIRRNGTLELYLDGSLMGNVMYSTNSNGPYNVNNDSHLYIGSIEQSQEVNAQFTGMIKEVRIWNYALSWDQIRALAYKKLTGSEQGLVGYYNFNQANGNDSSVTNNDASIVGNVQFPMINKFYRAYGIQIPTNTMITVSSITYSTNYQILYVDMNGYDPIAFIGAGQSIPMTCDGQERINIKSLENDCIWITCLYSENGNEGPFYASVMNTSDSIDSPPYVVVNFYGSNVQEFNHQPVNIEVTIQYIT